MADLYASSPITLSGSASLFFGNQTSISGIVLEGTAGLSVDVPSLVPTLSGESSFVVEGLLIQITGSGIYRVRRYIGEQNVPQDIKRLRRQVLEMARRMGTPVLIKKMLTDRDRSQGTVQASANFDEVYGQTRNRDPLSHGIGFTSVETSSNEWITPRGNIITSITDPGPGYVPAPKYRGFGPGYLTYVIEPDAAEDFFKHTQEGVFIKVQSAQAIAPWWPDIDDNDLLIHVELDRGFNVVGTQERYQAKMGNPVSIRGLDRRGKKEYSADFGNRHIINQTFEMALLPTDHEFYNVETDR